MSAVRRCLCLLFASFSALPLAGCSGHGDGGVGDKPSTRQTTRLGDGDRVSELVLEATWYDADNTDSTGCKLPADESVYVTGVTIVAIDRFDETGDGSKGNYYVQDTADDPPAFSGVTVYSPSFSPPDLRLAEGDIADLTGQLTEFPGPPSASPFGDCKTLPEMSGTMGFRLENGTRTPKTVPLEDLKSYPKARQWLGMLVRVEDVTISNVKSSPSGRYTASIDVGAGVEASDVPNLSNELFDLENEGPPIAAGTHLAAVTGVVTYFYGFKIAPRSKDDLEL